MADDPSKNSDQDNSSMTASMKDRENCNVGTRHNPEEENSASTGCRLNEEMLEYYYQQSKELERYKSQYDEAAYRVYGTIPRGVDPETFRAKMDELQNKRHSQVHV